jgi:DNA-binding transcriptional ArsR family regulator
MGDVDCVDALAALAQKTRLEAFRLLVRHEPDGLAAGELARLVDVPQNTLSAHLSILAHAGLVAGERHSRSIIYRAKVDAFQDLVAYLVRDCCSQRTSAGVPLTARKRSTRSPR